MTGRGDPLLDGWITKLRDPATQQTRFEFRNEQLEKCAVGHLLEIVDPDGWGGGWGRVPHSSYRAMKSRFGGRFIKGIEDRNDNWWWSLPELADYIEKKRDNAPRELEYER